MQLPVRKNRFGCAQASALLLICTVAVGLCETPARAGTLEDVRSSGVLQCGVDTEVVGFSVQQKNNSWVGMAADFCRGIALAVIGNQTKVNFNVLKPDERVEALQSGEIDILVSALPIDAEIESRDGLLFTEAFYFHSVADSVTAFAPAVRQGDDQWYLTVRWLRHLLLKNESTACENFDRFAGLEKDWGCNVLQNNGTYAEMLKRNFGASIPNDRNKVIGQGGWLYAPAP
jgi:ABC-type amino acid transport substrate-binding protein